LDVVQVLDDLDDAADEQENRRDRKDFQGDSPERHTGDAEGDQEGDHFRFLTSATSAALHLIPESSHRLADLLTLYTNFCAPSQMRRKKRNEPTPWNEKRH